MITSSHTSPRHRQTRSARAPRRGAALVFVLVFVIAMAALAMSSIFMASNANLLAKSYDRERDLRYAAEAALAIGKSRVNADPSILTMKPGQLDTIILKSALLSGADGKTLPGITVSVYVGPTGSTSGQFGRFSSIVAESRDQRGNGFIRRLELTQESFAKFAYWSNGENAASGATIFFNNGDEIWGPVWSNDTISIGSGGAKFHDEVGTVFMVRNPSYGIFSKGKKEYQKQIPLPSTGVLANLATISATSGWDFASGQAASNNEFNVRDRIEFAAVDLNASGDSTDLEEGLFRIYTARADSLLRGDWSQSGPPPTVSKVKLCGDWHMMRPVRSPVAATTVADTVLQFYPASVHNTTWFKNQYKQSLKDRLAISDTVAGTSAQVERVASLATIMSHAGARCFLPGDNHLVAVERNGPYADPRTGANYAAADYEKGGMDSTFTPVGVFGFWKLNPTAPPTAFVAARPRDASYTFPLDRLYNTNAKGVIHFNGNVGLSGTLNGRVTLYANGTIVLLDDLRYANDPVKGVCRDILGIISDRDIVIADNALNAPRDLTGTANYMNMDETPDMYIHAVLMALGNSFRVENYTGGPTNANTCGTTTNGRGCINLSGGIIQKTRGAVGLSSGQGFAKRYTYDRCAVVNPPPYFPTTGRFQDNRYLELDPAGFNHVTYFKTLTPDP